MAEMIFAGVNVKSFGAVGDGVTDDSAAINKALEEAEEVLFPGGTYAIKQNLTFPANKRILFGDGAKLQIASGITLKVNSGIHAGLYPIFTGAGRVVAGIPNQTAYPQWFGASGLTGTGGRGIVATGSIAAGSNVLTLDSGYERFEDGQTVMVLYAGRSLALTTPQAPAISLTTLWNGTVTTGSTTYGYRIVEMHPDGALSLPSPVAQVTNGPDNPDAFEYWMGTRISLKMPSAFSFAQGWAVYGEPTNPEGHRGLLAVQWKRQPEWHDVRNGAIGLSVPPWVPASLPTAPLSSSLMATILSGGGTDKLMLSAAAQTTVASVAIMANDAPAMQRAYDFLENGGGGTVELKKGRFYLHSPTGGDVKSAVFFTSNVTTRSEDRSILQTYPNFLVDGQVTISGKAGNVHHWGFEGIVFDGGNEVNTTEFYNWIFGTMPNAQGTGSYTNFSIRNCEFRYILGKGLVTGLGNCANYWIQDNYIHHCNSNAMSVGGRHYYVDRNICEYCLAATPAYIGGAESIILTESYQAQITNNTIRQWGNISAGNAFRYEDIEVSGNRFEDQNGIGFGGYCKNISIINNILNLNNRNHISGNGINWELTQGSGRYAYDVRISGNLIDCTGNLGAIALNVSTANTFSRITISDNTIHHRDTAFETVMVQNATGVVFSGNVITTEATANDVAVITTGGSQWTINGNRVPGKNIQVPDHSICTNNYAGGLRATGSSIISGNKLDGVQGKNTWGGLLNLAGGMNVVTNNEIDMSQAILPLAIAENSTSTGNVISGNLIKNFGARDPRSLLLHNFGSIVVQNTPYNTRAVESDRIPEQGVWTTGDKVFNNRPTPANAYEGWICTIGGTAARLSWLTGTAYEANSLVASNGKVYRAASITGDGRTGTTAPSHINGTAVDGSITWQFVDAAAVFKPFGAIVFGTVDQAPPATPQGLAATAGSRQVTLSWTSSTEPDLSGYYIYQNGRRINNTLVRAIPNTITGLTNGTAYGFQVAAADLSGNESLRSVTVTSTPRDVTPPAVPTGLSVGSGVNQLSLTWNANSEPDLAGYNIYRNGSKVNGTPLNATSYTDTGLTNGTTYKYEVTSVDADGNESGRSAPVSRAPGDAVPPAAPAGLSAVPGSAQVTLSWTANREADLASYNIYRDGARVNAAPVAGVTYKDMGLTNELAYTYTVTAVDTSGNQSPQSASVRVVPSEYRTVVVSDTFNRVAQLGLGQAETGQSWIPFLGQMRIRSNMAETNGPGANISIVESGIANCMVIGNVASKGNPAWLVFRAKDNQNYMLVSLRKDGYSTMEKIVNGKSNHLGIALPGAVYADGAEIKIILKGTRIDLYYNGTFMKTFNETFNQSETKHGLGGNYTDAYVDRFVILG
jgi:chitodextrinase